jgi:hypothetical protein
VGGGEGVPEGVSGLLMALVGCLLMVRAKLLPRDTCCGFNWRHPVCRGPARRRRGREGATGTPGLVATYHFICTPSHHNGSDSVLLRLHPTLGGHLL